MQGFNMGRYVPPDLEGTTSFNTASGKGHALGARARKLKSEGILVVRFECPFAIWCTNCQPEQIIGQGVRFNAEKKKVGNYYSTPIWSFKFKHTLCGNSIEVHTDPKNAEYVVVEGGRRRDTGADKLLDGEIRIGATEEEKQRMEADGGFGVLEKKLEDKKEADTQKRRIDELAKRSDRDWTDPYEMSRKLRKEFRVGRRQRQADDKSGEALQEKFGLGVDVVAPSKEDSDMAAFISFGEARSNEPSLKPLFIDQAAALSEPLIKDRGKRGKKGADLHVARRDHLQETLMGHTRNVLDPFLADDQSSQRGLWRPKLKRQRLNDTDKVDTPAPDRVPEVSASSTGKGLVSYESDSS